MLSIVKLALEKNSRRALTGCLIFSGDYFAQLLEGEEHDLLPVIGLIRKDVRHRQIATVYEGYSESRRFPEWSLAYIGKATFMQMKLGSLHMDSLAANNLVHVQNELLELFSAFRRA